VARFLNGLAISIIAITPKSYCYSILEQSFTCAAGCVSMAQALYMRSSSLQFVLFYFIETSFTLRQLAPSSVRKCVCKISILAKSEHITCHFDDYRQSHDSWEGNRIPDELRSGRPHGSARTIAPSDRRAATPEH
jgi:hypothetical protein